ncbi:hypothetical protein IQ235_10395 [Oscillatoriales cyanobacterium LEGE 11467]|uniref:Uncharacterized protein n=1 Tax=Zarconia navalis LEGE 11467 TaxID=1828826 RepID=A0A928VVV3_9CYAN|nr:hypothetical protein [Zarconia navalis]MBE9041187.1 hypothetical protein [Zarconia navalis LEGE 11467]
MTNCPCCSHRMLRHIRDRKVYWFCCHCWQEMPDLSELKDCELALDRNDLAFERLQLDIAKIAGSRGKPSEISQQ